MTALSADRDAARRDGKLFIASLVAAANVYAGALLEVDAAGRVKPATKGADKVYLGVAQHAADNSSGSAGDQKVLVHRGEAFHFAKTGTAVIGKDAYVVDDNTVTDDSTGASKLGRIIDSDDDGVWVLVD